MKHFGENAFTKNFNITSSTWYIEREIVVLLMKNFGQVAQNSFFFVYIEVFEGKFNFSKNYSAYRLQTLSQKFFPLGKNNSAGLSKMSSTSPGEHFGERVFENFFFHLRTLSQSVSVSAVKIFNKLVKTSFQVFRWQPSLKFFSQKVTVFHHHRKFRWFFSAFWWKIFTCNVKTAFSVFRGTICGKCVFFLDKLNFLCRLWKLGKNGQPFYRKVTAGFSRLRSACPEYLFFFFEKHFFWRSDTFFITFAKNWKSFALLSDKFPTIYSK